MQTKASKASKQGGSGPPHPAPSKILSLLWWTSVSRGKNRIGPKPRVPMRRISGWLTRRGSWLTSPGRWKRSWDSPSPTPQLRNRQVERETAPLQGRQPPAPAPRSRYYHQPLPRNGSSQGSDLTGFPCTRETIPFFQFKGNSQMGISIGVRRRESHRLLSFGSNPAGTQKAE